MDINQSIYSSGNTTVTINSASSLSTTIVIINFVLRRILVHLPLVLIIFGVGGFIGNTFTFLQRPLRSNTYCLYSLCGSIADVIVLLVNLLITYLYEAYGIITIPSNISSTLCKYRRFSLVFYPHLSTNILILSLIDRYICSCRIGSPLRRFNQIKMIPWLIFGTILVSFLLSIHSYILNDLVPSAGCITTQPIIESVLYIFFNGIMQSIVMFIFVLLTYRNIIRSRQRVVVITTTTNTHRTRNQFITMVFTQVLTTAFFSLLWIIIYIYSMVTKNISKSSEQSAIELLFYNLFNYMYYFNNVKSFFISLLTSGIFRRTFTTASINILRRCFR